MQIRYIYGIFKSTKKNPWIEKLYVNTKMNFSDISESKRPKVWQNDLCFGVFLRRCVSTVSKLQCVEKISVEMTVIPEMLPNVIVMTTFKTLI